MKKYRILAASLISFLLILALIAAYLKMDKTAEPKLGKDVVEGGTHPPYSD